MEMHAFRFFSPAMIAFVVTSNANAIVVDS